MIEAQALQKSFGTRLAVRHMSFSVAEGQIHGLLGPNGAGKTTTTRILACLLEPDRGRAWVAGFDTRVHPDRVRENIGILTEVPGLYERLNAWEYLDFFGQVHGLSGARRRARVEELLRLLGLWELRSQRLRSLSKGMKQKVAIARTLLHNPRVLFFDEPTAALDPEAAKIVRDHLIELIHSQRCTVLLCTHNLAEAERICARLSIVQDGRAVAEGTPGELKRNAQSRVELTLRDIDQRYVELVGSVSGVQSLAATNGVISYRVSDAAQVNPEVVRSLVAAGADIVSLQTQLPTLEDAYLDLMKDSTSADPVAAPAHPEPDGAVDAAPLAWHPEGSR